MRPRYLTCRTLFVFLQFCEIFEVFGGVRNCRFEEGVGECRTSLTVFDSRNHSAVGDDRPPIHRHMGGRPSSRPSPRGRATVLGRRDGAHRKRPSPHATTRRSGTTALPFTATWGDDRPPVRHHAGGRPSSRSSPRGRATVLGRRDVELGTTITSQLRNKVYE